MPVMTRRQCAQIVAETGFAKINVDENTRQKNCTNTELVGVLRDRWSNCQKTALVAMKSNRILEEKIIGLEASLEEYTEIGNTTSKHLLVAQDKINEQRSEIIEFGHEYECLENRHNELYEKYQEMSIAAGSQIASLDKTCENQAEVIDEQGTQINKFENNHDSNRVRSDMLAFICKVIGENMGPIRELIDSTKIDAVSAMRKALLNVIGVQYKSFDYFTKYELNVSTKVSGQNVEECDPPYEFICPISGDIMKHPIITSNGEIYDEKSIETWKKNLPYNKRNVKGREYCDDHGGNMESPLSRSWISGVFYPLVGLRTQIIEWREKRHHNNRALLGMVLHNLKYASEEAKKIIGPNSDSVIKSNETIMLNDEESTLSILRDMRGTILSHHYR